MSTELIDGKPTLLLGDEMIQAAIRLYVESAYRLSVDGPIEGVFSDQIVRVPVRPGGPGLTKEGADGSHAGA